MDLKVVSSAGRGRPSNVPRLERVNNDIKRLGFRREMAHLGPSGGRLFMGTSKLYKHGKC